MNGIFICWDDAKKLDKTWNHIFKDLSYMNIDNVFVFSSGYASEMKEIHKWSKYYKMSLHLVIDCFSSGITTDRYREILNEIQYVADNKLCEGICFDAIRFWQPELKNFEYETGRIEVSNFEKYKWYIKKWFNFIFSNYNKRCEIISKQLYDFSLVVKYNKLITSACVKAEFQNFKLCNLDAKMYGQNYKDFSKLVDFILPMTFENLYHGGIWKYINKKYEPWKIAKNIQADGGHGKIHPILWAYDSKSEYGYQRMPITIEIKIPINMSKMYNGGSVLFKYDDLKRNDMVVKYF